MTPDTDRATKALALSFVKIVSCILILHEVAVLHQMQQKGNLQSMLLSPCSND